MSFLDSSLNQSSLDFEINNVKLQDLYRLNYKQVDRFLYKYKNAHPTSITIDFDSTIAEVDQWVGLERFYILFEALHSLKTLIINTPIPFNIIQYYFKSVHSHQLTTLEFKIRMDQSDEKNDSLLNDYIQCIMRYFNQNTVLQHLKITWENLTENQLGAMSILEEGIKQHPNLISYRTNPQILANDFKQSLKEKAEKIATENEIIRSLFQELNQSHNTTLDIIEWLKLTYATIFKNNNLLLPNKRYSSETLTEIEGIKALDLFLSTTQKSYHQKKHYLKRLENALEALKNSALCQKTIYKQSIQNLTDDLDTIKQMISQCRDMFRENKANIDLNVIKTLSQTISALSNFSRYERLLSFKYSKIIQAVDYYALLAIKAIDEIYVTKDTQASEIKKTIIKLQDPTNILLQNEIKEAAHSIENRSASRHARYLAKTLFTIAALSALIGALSLLAIGLSVFTAGGSLALAAPCIAGATLALSPLLTGAGVVFQRQGMKIPNRLRSLEKAAKKISDHAFFKTKHVTTPHQSFGSPSQKR